MKKIYAKDLQPGSLIYSHRTNQAMFVISNSCTENQKTRLTWLPLAGRGEMFSVEISQYNAYIIL